MRSYIIAAGVMASVAFTSFAGAQGIEQTKMPFQDKFRQLEEVLPTPNMYRTGSGAPGHGYWQQKVDYKIKVTLDDANQRISGSEDVTYNNQSPDALKYLWVQMDQNRFNKNSTGSMTSTDGSKTRMYNGTLRARLETQNGDWGYKVTKLVDENGNNLSYTIVDTVMRIDLPTPLLPKESFTFTLDWNYNIVGGLTQNARGGKELYEKDGNYVYFISQWFPRLATYTDTDGWGTKAFLGSGEFSLEFGNYDVEITVPADHIVGSTGVLQNPEAVLTPVQQDRLVEAASAKAPIFIVTDEEALENQKEGTTDTKTWKFSAENVRDFAFASSRKFVWDAQGWTRPSDGKTVMAMSYYPEEQMPLWDKYSTAAVVHTLKSYSKHTFDYPYPVSISVNGPIGGGMEYPMITSNGPRVTHHDDGTRTYSRRAKYGLIGVVIHEVGHNWFPMIVDTDERNWTWMDEGLNSYLQTLTEREWEKGYPSRRSQPRNIANYMVSNNQVPIMTQSDSVVQFGNNAYAKPAAALNILRETIVGRELFDFAFKEYAQRWMYKRPYPADFFRTIEDASGVDLDWFWRGWFYTTDHVDLSIDKVTWAKLKGNPDEHAEFQRKQEAEKSVWQGIEYADDQQHMNELRPDLNDFYNENDQFTVTDADRKKHEGMLKKLKPWERDMRAFGDNIYFVDFSNKGGLVMPIILDVEYTDGSHEEMKIPAEIWRKSPKKVTKSIITKKEIKSISMDPRLETADADVHNNYWPRRAVETRLELFGRTTRTDLMRKVYNDKNPKKDEKKN